MGKRSCTTTDMLQYNKIQIFHIYTPLMAIFQAKLGNIVALFIFLSVCFESVHTLGMDKNFSHSLWHHPTKLLTHSSTSITTQCSTQSAHLQVQHVQATSHTPAITVSRQSERQTCRRCGPGLVRRAMWLALNDSIIVVAVGNWIFVTSHQLNTHTALATCTLDTGDTRHSTNPHKTHHQFNSICNSASSVSEIQSNITSFTRRAFVHSSTTIWNSIPSTGYNILNW